MTAEVLKNEKNIINEDKKEIIYIKTDTIIANRAQPREHFDEQGLTELTESIKQYGILQPLTVRRNPEKSRFSHFQYELIAGERRLRAAKRLNLTTVPCIVMEANSKTSAELAIIENLHRRDLGIFEEAAAIAALIDLHSLTQEQVASKLSLTQAAIANKLRILRLTDEERSIIIENNLTERHARAVLRIKDKDLRLKTLKIIADRMFHVKQAEDYIENLLHPLKTNAPNTPEARTRSINVQKLVASIEKAVELTRNGGKRIKTQHTETDSDIIITISIPKDTPKTKQICFT